MFNVLWRGLEEGLAVTEKLTVPLPVPLEPEVIVTQLSLLTAPHVQLSCVVTLTLPLPPAEPILWLDDESK